MCVLEKSPHGADLRKKEKSKRCFISGLEKSPDGVVCSKCDSFLFWRKVLLVHLGIPLGLFSQTKVEAP